MGLVRKYVTPHPALGHPNGWTWDTDAALRVHGVGGGYSTASAHGSRSTRPKVRARDVFNHRSGNHVKESPQPPLVDRLRLFFSRRGQVCNRESWDVLLTHCTRTNPNTQVLRVFEVCLWARRTPLTTRSGREPATRNASRRAVARPNALSDRRPSQPQQAYRSTPPL